MNTRKLSYSQRHLIALWITALLAGILALYVMHQSPELFTFGTMGMSTL